MRGSVNGFLYNIMESKGILLREDFKRSGHCHGMSEISGSIGGNPYDCDVGILGFNLPR